MTIPVHILYGQGGYITSVGLYNFGRSLDPKRFKVSFWNYGQWQAVMAQIIKDKPIKVALVGYSLGANAVAWLQMNRAVNISLLVGYDPTANGPSLYNYPIGRNVARCLCYQQTSWIGTSWLFGRGLYVRNSTGPQIEVTQFRSDHLLVPTRQDLHAKTRAALEAM